MNGSSRIRNYTRYVYQGGGRFHDLLRCALVLRNRRMSFGDRFCKWKLSSKEWNRGVASSLRFDKRRSFLF